MAQEKQSAPRDGWIEFTVIWFILAGLLNLATGIAALAKSDSAYFHRGDALVRNMTAWGVVWVIVAVAQLIASYLIVKRTESGRMTGIVLALISLFIWWFAFALRPWEGLAMWIINVAIMYALVTRRDLFRKS
jgi:hypothetical protein